MDGCHLYTTNTVWSGRFREVGRVYHLQALFYFLLFASLSASSFPMILVWALTLYRWVVAVRFLSILTIDASIVLSG
jgi:hypothetical protein